MKVAQEQHLDEVTAQSYITSAKAVVSVGWDRSIILHDETPQHALTSVRMTEEAHSADIMTVCHSPPEEVGLIVSAGADFLVRAWYVCAVYIICWCPYERV
jgi:WD40 repeat protein